MASTIRGQALIVNPGLWTAPFAADITVLRHKNLAQAEANTFNTC